MTDLKNILLGSTNGLGIFVDGDDSESAVLVHTCTTNSNVMEYVYLTAYNNSGEDVILTLEIGGVASTYTITAEDTTDAVVLPGIMLQGGAEALSITAFAADDDAIVINGYWKSFSLDEKDNYLPLSESIQGAGIAITDAATLVHETSTNPQTQDEVMLYLNNVGESNADVTIEFGDDIAPMVVTVEPTGMMLVIDEKILRGAATPYAIELTADTDEVITAYGYVRRFN